MDMRHRGTALVTQKSVESVQFGGGSQQVDNLSCYVSDVSSTPECFSCSCQKLTPREKIKGMAVKSWMLYVCSGGIAKRMGLQKQLQDKVVGAMKL